MADTPENIGEQIARAVERHKHKELKPDEELDTQIADLRMSIRGFLDESKDANDRVLRENALFSAIEKVSEESDVSVWQIAILLFSMGAYEIDRMTFGIDPSFERAILFYLANSKPWFVLSFADRYKDQPYAASVIQIVAEKSPEFALVHADRYKDQPYAASIIGKAVRIVVEKNPRAALAYADLCKDQPYAASAIQIATEKDPRAAFLFAYGYRDQPYAASVIQIAAGKDPRAALEYADLYRDQPYAASVIEKSIKLSPAGAYRNFSRIEWFLQNSEDQIVRDIHAFFIKIKYEELPPEISLEIFFPLAHLVIRGEFDLDEVSNIVKNPTKFMKKLVELKNIPDVIGQYDIEEKLKEISLKIVREINDLHNASDSIRFASVADSSPEELYYLMTYGEEEVFTSSFNGFFDRMMGRLKKAGQNGYDLLTKTSGNKFRIFIKLCASYGRLGEFLNTMEESQKTEILERFVSNLEKNEEFLAEAVTVADTFASLNEPQLLLKIQTILKREYERAQKEKNEKGVKIYGLLAGMFGANAAVDEQWYAQIAEKYKMQDVSRLPSEDLFNPDGSNVQQHFFYGDKDGIASFGHFLKTYKDKNGWKTEDKGKFVVITKQKGPKKVVIYANKPQNEDDGIQEVSEELQKNKVERIVVVHRGHGYHAGKTIEAITPAASIVFLGSCGGYNNVSSVLSRSGKAHIIATKGTGKMSVNDPLLYSLNEKILTGGDIHWQPFWNEAEKVLGRKEDFHKYVPPHKNLGALFLKAYAQL